MRRGFRRFKRTAAVLGAATLLQLGPCLPNNYFANVGQNAAVSLTNTVVEVILAQIAMSLGLPIDNLTVGGTSSTTN